MIEPPTIPDPEEVPRTEFVCGHEDGAGRRFEGGTARCGRCGGVLGQIVVSDLCSCQKAGAYSTECLLTARCADR